MPPSKYVILDLSDGEVSENELQLDDKHEADSDSKEAVVNNGEKRNLDLHSPTLLEDLIDAKITAKDNITWTNKKFIGKKFEFDKQPESDKIINKRGNRTPIQIFEAYIPDGFLDKVVVFTNKYGRKNLSEYVKTNVAEIRKLFGCLLLIGLQKQTSIKACFDPQAGIKLVQDNFRLRRFYQLRSALHFVDVNKPPKQTDVFWKLRPLMEVIRSRLHQLEVEEYVSVDESVVPFTGQHRSKRYFRDKPNPLGFELIQLNGVSGMLYEFVEYQGASTRIDGRLINKYGASAAKVLHLIQRLQNVGHTITFDNLFTTYALLEVLYNLKLNAIGRFQSFYVFFSYILRSFFIVFLILRYHTTQQIC